MSGQLFAAGMGILLLFLGGAATLITFALKPPGLPDLEPPPPAPRRRRARLTRRSAADRQREQELIAVALAAGYDLPFLARALRGNPEHNRRRVRKVRIRMQQKAVTA